MPRKTYTIANLCCANCAAKIEAKINQLEGVSASITFATKQLRIEAKDPDRLLPQLQKIVSAIEPDAKIVTGKHHDDHHHGEQESLLPILLGALLFAAGLVLDSFFTYLPLAAYLSAWLVLGWQVLYSAGKSLIRGRMLDENFLMSIATLGAFAIGEYPEAVGIMLFFRIGEYFEHRAVSRSRSQIMEAVDLRPETVQLLYGGTIAAAEAEPGDLLLIRPGDRIPLDGTILHGTSTINTAPITGESLPMAVEPGTQVLSGCINGGGQLTLRVDKVLAESMVTRILEAVENAAAGKPKIDRFITRFAKIYTPIVVASAALIALVPSLISGDWNYWVYTALSFLVMSCPCALVLSVPLAFFSGIGVGSKRGILFKGGASIEALAKVKQAALDKTGTVTLGQFGVQKVVGSEEILELCAACERGSNHPLAQSIVAAAQTNKRAESMEEIPGYGIRAVLSGKQIFCGNEKLMAQAGISIPADLDPGTKVFVAEEGKLLGYILLADQVKTDAKAAVERLEKLSVSTSMLTGDSRENAEAVAKQTGIGQVFAQLLPQEKLERLQALRQEGGSILFVGDGINDAPVLAGADVGAAMGSGADAAIEAADVVFLQTALEAVPDAIAIARRTKAVAWQNVVFALVVKAAVMGLGLAGLASMWLAVFADSGVAMLCVLNSIRQLYRKK